jgi:ATP-dependent Clp protease ATP-binding subunit ClpC
VAYQIVDLAEQEAAELGCGYVSAEHILLALLRQQSGVAAQVLRSPGISFEDVRGRYLRSVHDAQERLPYDVRDPAPFCRLGKELLDVPWAERAKRVLEMAVGEALTLGTASIETEHILLGLIRERDSPATQISDRA